MQITLGTTEALGNEKWSRIEDGLCYWVPGKIMVVQGDDQVMIVDFKEEKLKMQDRELEQMYIKTDFGDLEEAIRAAL